ncbi:MAG: ABC transporter permease [Acidobacteriota bacterium]
MNALFQDIRYSLRAFGRNVVFSLTLILVLALGISGTTSIFTIVYGVLLQPLPFSNPDRLILIAGAAAPPGHDRVSWWQQSTVLDSLCVYNAGGINLHKGDSSVRTNAAVVSASFFKVFGAQPQLGRAFTPDDEKPGYNRIAIVSKRFWRDEFNHTSDIVGKTVMLNGIQHTVVGVMPDGFSYPGRADVWTPRAVSEAYSSNLDVGDNQQEQPDLSLSLRADVMVGRLKPDVSLQQGREQLKLRNNQTAELERKAGLSIGDGINVILLHEVFVSKLRQSLWVLFAGVTFLLLIACANAATLMLSRAVSKQKEIAMRLCLGASRFRIVRLLLTESVLISLMGGVSGVILAYWLVELFRFIGPRTMPRLADVQVNGIVLIFTLTVSICVGVIVGLAPAIQTFSIKLTGTLKEEGGRSISGARRRVRQALVIIEVALAFILLAGAGLSIKSLFQVTAISPGFNPEGVLTLNLSLPAARYKGTVESQGNQPASYLGASRASLFYKQLFETLGSLPGVKSVGGVDQLPLGIQSRRSLWVDVPGTSGGTMPFLNVTGDFIRAMEIPVTRGRAINSSDTEASPKVVVVNETFARNFWGSSNPIGQTIEVDGEATPREVIGVVGDIKLTGLTGKTSPQMYLPYQQPYRSGQLPLALALVVRTDVKPSVMIGSLRKAILSVDPTLPIFQIKTMEEVVHNSTAEYRFRGVLMGGFALIAMLMAVVGVYGVVAYSARARTYEMGVRMTLGATPRKVMLMILNEGWTLALVGVAIGIPASLWLAKFIAGILYGVSPTNPLMLVSSAVLVMTGALLACIIPAFSVSRIAPVVALRHS